MLRAPWFLLIPLTIITVIALPMTVIALAVTLLLGWLFLIVGTFGLIVVGEIAYGGGVGWLARKHGLAANSVTAVELVTSHRACASTATL